MTPTEALDLLSRACAQLQANLETHKALLEARETLHTFIEANTPKPEED